MKIEKIAIEKLKPNPINPRIIGDVEFKNLVKSLQECPQLFEARPCICSDRTGELIILGGNMRFKAALSLGWHAVPVIIMHGLTEAQEKEIAIKDNGDFGQWDFELLEADFSELKLADWGVELPQLKDFAIPESNKAIDEDAMLDTKNECPKCGFKW